MASLFSSSSSFHILTCSGPKFAAPAVPSSVRLRTSHTVSAVSSTANASRSGYYNLHIHQSVSTNASLYDILGIQMGASHREIKTAYRSLARVMHPDVVSSNGQGDSSAEAFLRISAAYTTLSDAHKRAEYDLQMSRTRSPYYSTSAVNSRYNGYTSQRSWETDQCW
ncbi:J domain-containing protein [Heracleum sosnowskyi]|uniref:J domain-containing protein n=1 Tax=Heracleum sosnowskyi TaxID=360622 RepID=A0AAD8IWF9_9APIA|nr:J domain-containing protein [Heracleum sosnowskyi]